MRKSRLCFLFPAVLALALLIAPAANGHQQPPGCELPSPSVSFVEETMEQLESRVRLGDEVTLGVRISNPGRDSCLLTDVTVLAHIEPEGAPAETFTLWSGASVPSGLAVSSWTPGWVVDAPPAVFEIPISLTWTAVAHTGEDHIDLTGEPVTVKLMVTRPEAVLKVTPDRVSGAAPLAVTYTYELTNTSPPHPAGSPAPSLIAAGGGDPLGVVSDGGCEPLVFLNGGGPSPNKALEPGETWRYSCSRTFTLPGIYSPTPALDAVSDTDDRPWPLVLSPENTPSISVLGSDLVVSKSHQGDFIADRSGQYTLRVTNSGNQATSGQVVLTDLLPAGLTATAMSGQGWNCSLANLRCTRSNPLASGSSYPDVTLTVRVAPRPPSHVINRATVSGGGESSGVTGNNTAEDPTRIRTPAVPGSARSRFQIRQVQVRGDGSARIRVTAPRAGRLVANDAGRPNLVRRAVKGAPVAGTYTLVVRAGKRLRRLINRSKRPRNVRVRVTFIPKVKAPTLSATRVIRFRLR